MRITLLCNAGLALELDGAILLVDVPNLPYEPFYPAPEGLKEALMRRETPYDRVCGLYFTHVHPDHCDRPFADAYRKRYPEIPVFFPEQDTLAGRIDMGPFCITYKPMAHAPIPQAPPHVITLIEAGGKRIYLGADAALDCGGHMAFLEGRRVDAAFWNSMYLSRADTRQLLQAHGKKNYIYHMPAEKNDGSGLWRKCQRNFQRYGGELQNVTVLDVYPSVIEI